MKNQITKDLKLVLNVAHAKSSLFKNHIKSQIQDDAETLQRLLRQAENGSLEALQGLKYYEQMYQDMIDNARWCTQSDALNHVSFKSSHTMDNPVFAEKPVADWKLFAVEHAADVKAAKSFAGKVSALKRKMKKAKAGK